VLICKSKNYECEFTTIYIDACLVLVIQERHTLQKKKEEPCCDDCDDLNEEDKITLHTDPNYYGADVGNYKAKGPTLNIPTHKLVGFEPDKKMELPKSKANVEKIVAGIKNNDPIPPILVRKHEDGYQVVDGHHRFWAHKTLGSKTISAKLVPHSDIIIKGKVNEEEGSSDPTKGKGIGKPWREGGGGAVYVRTGDGGVKKVRFSQSGMAKKYRDPARLKSFMARHNCLGNKDKTSASYWACRYPRFFSNTGQLWW